MGRKIIKWFLYILLLVLLFALQSALGYRAAIFGTKPDLMPILAVTVSVFEGYAAGGWFGLLIGLLCDTFHPVSEGFYAIFYLVFMSFCGFLTEKYFRKSYVTVLLWGAAALVLSNFFQYLVFYAVFDRVDFPYFFQITGGELVYTLAVSFAAYLPCRGIWLRFGLPGHISEHAEAGRIFNLRTGRRTSPPPSVRRVSMQARPRKKPLSDKERHFWNNLFRQ